MARTRIFIPTLNAGPAFADTLRAVSRQSMSAEVVVADSGSSDRTVDIARHFGARIIMVAPEDFDHGGTRNLALVDFAGDVLVFLSQDAIPVGVHWLDSLIAPILSGAAAASYSRQVAHAGATPIEAFARSFNYPATSIERSWESVEREGVRAVFFSNVSSAVSVAAFKAVGGFPARAIMNEDMALAARLLRSGHTVRYSAESEVHHSHDYSLGRQFSRSFDIGVFFSDLPEGFPQVAPSSEGTTYVVRLTRHLVSEGYWGALPRAHIETGLRFLGYKLGRAHRALPRRLKLRMTMNKRYWARSS